MGTYQISPTDRVVPHTSGAFAVLRDGGFERDHELEVLAVSGDALVTLATRLDALNQSFDTDSVEYAELERTVRALLYLQQNYRLTKR